MMLRFSKISAGVWVHVKSTVGEFLCFLIGAVIFVGLAWVTYQVYSFAPVLFAAIAGYWVGKIWNQRDAEQKGRDRAYEEMRLKRAADARLFAEHGYCPEPQYLTVAQARKLSLLSEEEDTTPK